MPEPVYRVLLLWCAVVKTVPIGTNLGLVEVLWMLVPATPADRTTSWEEGGVQLRARQWIDLVLPTAPATAPTFSVIAVFDPRYHDPLLLATPLPLSPRAARDLYRERWPVEQLPLAAKQMTGAARQFVHEPETCQRLPELSLLIGSVLSYAAATQPAVPAGDAPPSTTCPVMMVSALEPAASPPIRP